MPRSCAKEHISGTREACVSETLVEEKINIRRLCVWGESIWARKSRSHARRLAVREAECYGKGSYGKEPSQTSLVGPEEKGTNQHRVARIQKGTVVLFSCRNFETSGGGRKGITSGNPGSELIVWETSRGFNKVCTEGDVADVVGVVE